MAGYCWRSRRAGGGRVGGEGFSPPAEAHHVAQARPDPARAGGDGAHRPSRLSQGQPPAQAERRARRHLRRRGLCRSLPQARPAGAAAVAAGSGHHPAIPREPARPAGRRGGAGPPPHGGPPPDRRAAEAVRARIDWKYLLGLELTDPGFDHSVLCEFRARLLEGSAEERLLRKLLEVCQARGLLKARGRQRTDATHVLASIRVLNRLELLGETLRAALNELATVAPDWLREVAPRDWYERYAHR